MTAPALTTLPSVGLDLTNSSSLQARQTRSSGLPYSFEWDDRSGRRHFHIGYSTINGAKGAVVRNVEITLASQTGGRSLAGSGHFLIEDPQSPGFAPAFLEGGLHMTKLPERACSPHAGNPAGVKESMPLLIPPQTEKSLRGLAAIPRLVFCSWKTAIGHLGPLSGLMGFFAEKRSAELFAMQSFAEYRASPQAKSQDWSAAIDAQQLLEPWPDAYPPESTPPEPTPTLTYLQNLPALSNKEQVDEPADVRFRRGMTRIRLLEKAKFWMLDTVRRSGKKIEEHSFAKSLAVTTLSLMDSLCIIQQRPAFLPAILDLDDKAVASAYTSSEEQMSSWQGDDAVNQSLRRGLLAYTIPGIWLDMPTLVGSLRFTPVFTNRHTATMAWRCLNLSGTPLLEQQPLQAVIAAAQEHNKAKLRELAANFKSVASTVADTDTDADASTDTDADTDDNQQLTMSNLWPAGVPAIMPAMGMIGCRLGPHHMQPMTHALRTLAQNLIHSAVTKGAEALHENWTETVRFPVQVPVLPHDWQDSHAGTNIPQTYATVHFDKAVKASGQRAPEACETPGAQGLLLIGDIGFEDHETPSDFQTHPEAKLEVTINFQNVAGVAQYL